MHAFLVRADDVLRRRPRGAGEGAVRSPVGWLAADVVVFGIVYGAVMGLFGGVFGDRMWQVCFSALKVPLLLVVTFLLGLPCFFVLNTLLGLRQDFADALRALLAAQAGLAIILASLAPLTAFWYASSGDYHQALLFNGLMFAVASFSAQGLVRAYYRPLVARDRRHRWMLWTWLGLYVFVGIQMAWVLRPFVGAPDQPVQFIRAESWGNAYEVVLRLVWRAISP
jgi:hypothetical protein